MKAALAAVEGHRYPVTHVVHAIKARRAAIQLNTVHTVALPPARFAEERDRVVAERQHRVAVSNQERGDKGRVGRRGYMAGEQDTVAIQDDRMGGERDDVIVDFNPAVIKERL